MTQAPKKAKSEDTEEEAAFKQKKKEEQEALKAARDRGECRASAYGWENADRDDACSAEG